MRMIAVETKQDLSRFIKVPWKIYQYDSCWVPPLIMEIKTKLDKKKNPFWKHSEQKLFIAARNGEVVGRIAGVIDRNYNQFQNEKTGFFAFFESINNTEVSKLLLDSVKGWLKENGMNKILGPTAPSTNDEMGLLYEGYDSDPFIMMPHNPKYYHDLLEGYGLKKAKDLYAYSIDSPNVPLDRLKKINETVMKRIPGLVVRHIDMKKFDREVEYARQVYNLAWEKNWGFVPWTDEEFSYQCKSLKFLVIPDTVLLAFIKDKPIGMLIAVPNYNELLKRLNGKLGPVELVKLLWYKNKIKTMRTMVMGVIKEYRNRGIEGILCWKVISKSIELGFPKGEFSWVLEDNVMMNRTGEMLGGKLYKKYRVYEMEI